MPEYIDRERLKEAFNADLQTLQSLDEHTMNLILMEIDEAPAADVVPVVRCRECNKSSYDSFFKRRWCNRTLLCVRVKDDDFCSYGEKRD